MICFLSSFYTFVSHFFNYESQCFHHSVVAWKLIWVPQCLLKYFSNRCTLYMMSEQSLLNSSIMSWEDLPCLPYLKGGRLPMPMKEPPYPLLCKFLRCYQPFLRWTTLLSISAFACFFHGRHSLQTSKKCFILFYYLLSFSSVNVQISLCHIKCVLIVKHYTYTCIIDKINFVYFLNSRMLNYKS